jgi:hypothetical protein
MIFIFKMLDSLILAKVLPLLELYHLPSHQQRRGNSFQFSQFQVYEFPRMGTILYK